MVKYTLFMSTLWYRALLMVKYTLFISALWYRTLLMVKYTLFLSALWYIALLMVKYTLFMSVWWHNSLVASWWCSYIDEFKAVLMALWHKSVVDGKVNIIYINPMTKACWLQSIYYLYQPYDIKALLMVFIIYINFNRYK